MWIPQISMSVGTFVFALAMVDRFISIALFGFDESAEKIISSSLNNICEVLRKSRLEQKKGPDFIDIIRF